MVSYCWTQERGLAHRLFQTKALLWTQSKEQDAGRCGFGTQRIPDESLGEPEEEMNQKHVAISKNPVTFELELGAPAD